MNWFNSNVGLVWYCFFLPICASFNTFLCKSLISALSSILDLELGRPYKSRPAGQPVPWLGILCDKCGQDTLLSCYPCCTAENKVTQVNSTLNRVLIEAFINFYTESMSEENSCCGFKRKTVCMSLIGMWKGVINWSRDENKI